MWGKNKTAVSDHHRLLDIDNDHLAEVGLLYSSLSKSCDVYSIGPYPRIE